MSFNLLDLLKSEVGSQLAGQASKFLGESESNTSKALDGIFPSLLGMIANKATDTNSSSGLISLMKGLDLGSLSNIAGLFGGGSSAVNGLMNTGGSLVSGLFGDKLGAITGQISDLSGISKSSSSSLLKMAAPLVMGTVMNKATGSDGKFGLGALTSLLGGQAANIKDAIPSALSSTLGLGNLSFLDKVSDFAEDAFEKTIDTAEDFVKGAAGVAGTVARKSSDMVENIVDDATDFAKDGAKIAGQAATKTYETGKDLVEDGVSTAKPWLKWLIPLFLVLLLLGWLASRGCNTGVDAVDNAASATYGATTDVVDGAADMAADGANAVADASQKVASASVEVITNALSKVDDAALAVVNGLKFTAGSASDQFNIFIKGGGKGENRFTFKNLSFATASDKLDGKTISEIDEIGKILKAYPDVKIIVEGYTDNVGEEAMNLKLSQDRAKSVKSQLISGGIAGDRIQTEGYGSANPVGDNSTEAGKAKNRRIEFRIVQ